ncbi:hypothetical protein LEP1GSC151_2345 [Leptospira interrogans serovar Grippotyphosa str. LT2186]|uniref:Uncharacterized protein n=2 Tax=Leptospira interrogans TaxID=173 RepID=M3GUA8_LEPIR|nr:hypothetical protein LEP1GSC067_3814 [Leptospira interrogans serovar Lora str. TE 1992]EMG10253.1 hypothetical protein LEP1GSC151_2345 [Leptospira interrogans serovar Grippotyphosa str. LT2186]
MGFKKTKDDREVFFCLDLTLDSEFQFRGKLANLLKILDTLPKGNPVIVLSQRKVRSIFKKKKIKAYFTTRTYKNDTNDK